MAKLRSSEATKKLYWKRKRQPKFKGLRSLRFWDSHRQGTAYRDGTETRDKKGWYITEGEFKRRQAQGVL